MKRQQGWFGAGGLRSARRAASGRNGASQSRCSDRGPLLSQEHRVNDANYRLEPSKPAPEKKMQKSAIVGDHHADLISKKSIEINDLVVVEMT